VLGFCGALAQLPPATAIRFTRYLSVVPRPLFAAVLVVRRKYFIAVPRPMPAAPRRYFIVVPRPLPAVPLVDRPRYLILVPKPIPAAPRWYLAVVPRPSPRGAARCASQVYRCARPLPAVALIVHRRAVFIYRGVKAVARGGARCEPKVLEALCSAAFVVNSEPHTGARPSVRLCVGLTRNPDMLKFGFS
jgi:hypothetical protein